MGTLAKTEHSIRRSTRLPLEVPVVVTEVEAGFTARGHTTLVNAHGCGLVVPRAMVRGIEVQLEIVSANRHARARVAEVVALGGNPETWLVGLELKQPGNFWGIEYAPSDWKVAESSPAPSPDEQEKRESTAEKAANALHWRLTDISSGACYLETVAPFPAETSVLLSIRALGKSCVLDGVVRVSHAQVGMGIEFRQTRTGGQRAIAEKLIERLAGDGKAPRIFVGRKESCETASHEHLAANGARLSDPLLELIRAAPSLTVEQFQHVLRAQRTGKDQRLTH